MNVIIKIIKWIRRQFDTDVIIGPCINRRVGKDELRSGIFRRLH
jgi:hypothetical protein